jgi:hypothetical protein
MSMSSPQERAGPAKAQPAAFPNEVTELMQQLDGWEFLETETPQGLSI